MFIEYVAGGRSSREKELVDAKARSHAARYAWAYHKSLQRRRVQHKKPGRLRPAIEDEDATTESGQGAYRRSPSQSVTSTSPGFQKASPILRDQFLSADEYWQLNQDMLSSIVGPPQSYSVHLDSNRLRSIEYFPELWSRWAADVIPNRANRQAATTVAVNSIVQRCLTDELHMSAFISYVLQRAPEVNVSKVFLMQTAAKALTELRLRIEGGNTSLEEVVWPIIFLAHYELFGSKSIWAGRSHLKAVVELGGMEYLDEVTKVYIRRMDRGWWSDHPSIFPPSQSPQPQLKKLVPDISNHDTTGSGFFDHANFLGSELTEILPFVIDCVRAGVICKSRAMQGFENEILQNKVIRQCQKLMDILRVQLPAGPEKIACIYPTMIWLQYTTWVMRDLATQASSSVDAYRNITSHAHPNLLSSVRQSSHAFDMLLWASAVGIATSSDEAVRIQYASRALMLVRDLNVLDLRIACKRYIWFEASAIIDYNLICAALDEAVRVNPLLASHHWATTRRALFSGR